MYHPPPPPMAPNEQQQISNQLASLAMASASASASATGQENTRTKRPARAFHQEPTTQHSLNTGLNSPMPPRPELHQHQQHQQQQHHQPAFRHRPDRPEHLQNYHHRPMPVVLPGPPLEPQNNSIPPLPSAPGQKLPGPRNRIDPNQIPSPVIVHEQDALTFSQEPFRTCQAIHANPQSFPNQPNLIPPTPPQVPLSLTDVITIDEGNCSPRFMRSTTYCLPSSQDLASAAELPLGLVIQPLAELHPAEGGCVPVVDFSQDPNGPPRCSSCRGYINPWCTFIDGGHRFLCNLCGKSSDVPSAYFCHLDMSGRRADYYQRPELCRGSIDFVVNQDYWVQSDASDSKITPRLPEPIKILFAIDVSWAANKSGLLGRVTRSIKSILFNLPLDQDLDDDPQSLIDLGFPQVSDRPHRSFPLGAKIGFVTFDRTVHFYNLKAGLEQAQMLVVSDLDDMFVPISEESLYVDPRESPAMIHNLLDSLPTMFAENQIMESALSGPVMAALSSLRRLGGQVNIFLTSLPTIGPGSLKQREDTKLYNTEKEMTLFTPAHPWYRQVSEECCLAGIGINLFLFPSQYIDIATISVLSGITGGQVFFHPRFNPDRDHFKLHAELRRVLTRETAASVTMRIRCSNGLRISEHFGSFLQRNVTDLEFGNLDSDKAVGAMIKIEGKLEDQQSNTNNGMTEAQIQCALLYTSATGQRRVRCLNLAIPITRVIGNVFRSADMDATITLLTKQYVAQITQVPLRDVRGTLTESCVKILLAYRKHCASSTSPGQLILPESYKLFPLYALGLMKTKALKGGNVSSDVRSHYMRYLKSLNVPQTILTLYPRLVPLHSLQDSPISCSFHPDSHKFISPPLMRASYLRMEPHGVYLIENGDVMIMWIGSEVSTETLNKIFGTPSLPQLEDQIKTHQLTRLPTLKTDLSVQIRRLIKFFEVNRPNRSLPLVIARQGLDASEFEFANLLVEDQNNDAMSYVDYLCFVHKQIQNELGSNPSSSVDHSSVNNDHSSSNFIDPAALWRSAW